MYAHRRLAHCHSFRKALSAAGVATALILVSGWSGIAVAWAAPVAMASDSTAVTQHATDHPVGHLTLAEPGPAVLDGAALAVADRYGAAAAAQILRDGGNAVDAAVAIAFTLAVTYPEAGNIGGGGFMTLWVNGHPYFLDYRERAPKAATRDMYLDANGKVIPGASLVGPRSVGVPGTVAGMWEAQQRFGRLPWSRVLAPAIAYARDGFLVDDQLEARKQKAQADFAGKTNFDTYFAGMQQGKVFVQSALADTLQRIADQGAKGFYTGKTASLIAASMRDPHDPQDTPQPPGLITTADLAAYKAVWRAPVVADWEGFQVITAPPPSSGGVGLVQLLRMKSYLAPHFAGIPLNTPQYIHLTSEIEKRVFADRAQYLGDPDFYRVPVAQLIDPLYLRKRAAEVDPVHPSPTASVLPGLPDDVAASVVPVGRAAPHAADQRGNAPQVASVGVTPSAHALAVADASSPAQMPERMETTHFSVIDKWGNAVSNTYTINGYFGSGVVVAGAGFLLNDEMDDFSAKPGVANMFGVVGSDANAIAPFKRPLSSMSPTILTRDGRVALVLGTPGGSRIFTTLFQVIENVYSFQMPLDKAVAATRFHHQLLPANTLFWEPYTPIDGVLAKQVEARGYTLKPQAFNGDVQAIQVQGDTPVPVADPRGRGVTMVVK